jgi:hypothetical protein
VLGTQGVENHISIHQRYRPSFFEENDFSDTPRPCIIFWNDTEHFRPFPQFTDKKLVKALKRLGLTTGVTRVVDPVKTVDDKVLEGSFQLANVR